MTTTTPTLQISEIFSITVDYSKSREQMVAAGQYGDKCRNSVLESCSIEGKGTVSYEACYCYFDRDISLEDAIKEIGQVGWSPAKIEDLLSFGATYPEEQRQFHIVALGTIGPELGVATLYAYRESFLIVPAHESRPRIRSIGYLNVRYGLSVYPGNHRFLVVRSKGGDK